MHMQHMCPRTDWPTTAWVDSTVHRNWWKGEKVRKNRAKKFSRCLKNVWASIPGEHWAEQFVNLDFNNILYPFGCVRILRLNLFGKLQYLTRFSWTAFGGGTDMIKLKLNLTQLCFQLYIAMQGIKSFKFEPKFIILNIRKNCLTSLLPSHEYTVSVVGMCTELKNCKNLNGFVRPVLEYMNQLLFVHHLLVAVVFCVLIWPVFVSYRQALQYSTAFMIRGKVWLLVRSSCIFQGNKENNSFAIRVDWYISLVLNWNGISLLQRG